MNGVNPVTVEVIRNGLIAASRDIRRTIERAAYSPILHEVVDFSCAILDSEANVLGETAGLPSFLGSLGYAVESAYKTIGRERIRPGDVIICNDPYNGGGTHCPDIAALCPTFFQNELQGWAAFRGHTVDMGGMHPGGWYSDTTEVFQEGVRFPPVKLYADGEPQQDIFHMIAANTRVPRAVVGDVRAMATAVQKGSQRYYEIFAKYGLDVTLGAIQEILDQGERMSRAAIRTIPNGVYRGEAIFDGDGSDDAILDEAVKIKVAVTVEDEEMTIDFAGTDPPCKGPLNVPEPSTICTARYAFKMVTTPFLPNNDGFSRPLKIVIPDGSLLNAQCPSACALWGPACNTVADLILKTLAPAIPDRVRAGHFGDCMSHFIYGTDPRSGEYYVCAQGNTGGYGGKPTQDGESGFFCMMLGDTYNVPAEVTEIRHPWRLERLELIQDSGGPGRHRGGLGVRREYRIGSECGLTVTAERCLYTPPWGLFGGKPGGTNITVIQRKDGSEERWRKVSDLRLSAGDLVSFQGGGGGGYGLPLERKPEDVLSDVRNGYVSKEKAEKEYGIVIDQETMAVNIQETQNLRPLLGGRYEGECAA